MELKRAVIYARYSSHNQKEESIEGQVRVCKEYAERYDWEIVGEYVDRAISGTTDKRPDFKKMIQESKQGDFDVVLVYKFDRFARDRYDSATYKKVLKENNVILVSAMENIPNTPEGIILEGLLESMAEYYSAELSQKILRGKKEKSLKLQHHGGVVPFGYKLDENQRYIIDEDNAPLVKEIFNRYAEGDKLTSISLDMNFVQLRKNSNQGLSTSCLSQMLKHPIYIGTFSASGYTQENAVDPIIDRDTWDRVQDRKEKNKKTPGKNKAKEPYLLSGKVVCGHCGEKVVGESGGSPLRQYYKCQGRRKKNGCTKETMKKAEMEQLVFSMIMDTFSCPERQKEIARKCTEYTVGRNEDSDLLISLKKQLKDTERRSDNIAYALSQRPASPTLLQLFDDLEQATIKLRDEVRRNSYKHPTVKEKDVIALLTKLIEGDGDKVATEKILWHLVSYVKWFDDKIILCFDLLGTEERDLEIVHFFEGVNLSDISGSP